MFMYELFMHLKQPRAEVEGLSKTPEQWEEDTVTAATKKRSFFFYFLLLYSFRNQTEVDLAMGKASHKSVIPRTENYY